MPLSTEELVRVKAEGDPAGQMLGGTVVQTFIEAWPNNSDMAAAECADAIAAKYADGFNFSEDGQSFNRRERFEHYTDLAKRLRSRGGQYVWPFTVVHRVTSGGP